MDATEVFSSKAEIYAKYRWSYAPEAIKTIFDHTGITHKSCVADIGAGTGILTREFVGKVNQILAVEPNPEMRAIAARELGCFPSCQILSGRAEATTLSDHSVDLIVAAQAVHFFEPEPTRHEFYRILKSGGWLVFCRNYGTNEELGDALQEIYPSELDTETLMVGKRQPKSFYFCGKDHLKLNFPIKSQLNWEAFLGVLSTASFAPDIGSGLYEQFERKARIVFDRFNTNGYIEEHGKTELYLGQIVRS